MHITWSLQSRTCLHPIWKLVTHGQLNLVVSNYGITKNVSSIESTMFIHVRVVFGGSIHLETHPSVLCLKIQYPWIPSAILGFRIHFQGILFPWLFLLRMHHHQSDQTLVLVTFASVTSEVVAIELREICLLTSSIGHESFIGSDAWQLWCCHSAFWVYK